MADEAGWEQALLMCVWTSTVGKEGNDRYIDNCPSGQPSSHSKGKLMLGRICPAEPLLLPDVISCTVPPEKVF